MTGSTESLQEMLVGGRIKAGNDIISMMRLITGGDMIIERGVKTSSPP